MKGIITDPFGSSLRNLKSQSSLDEQQTKHSNKLLLPILSLTTTQRMHIKSENVDSWSLMKNHQEIRNMRSITQLL